MEFNELNRSTLKNNLSNNVTIYFRLKHLLNIIFHYKSNNIFLIRSNSLIMTLINTVSIRYLNTYCIELFSNKMI